MKINVVTGRYGFKLPGTEEIDGVMIHRLVSSRMPLLRGVSFVPLLQRFLIRHAHRYDVVHMHAFGWYLLAVIPIVKKLGLSTLLKLPNVGDYGLRGIRKRKFGGTLMKLFKSVDAFIAMSQDSRVELLQEGIRSSRIFEVNNGIDTSIFNVASTETEKARLRASLSLPNGKLCLFTGRLSQKKGVADLLAVWPKVVERIPSAHLILCGSGPQESELHDLAQSNGTERTVHFRGRIENVAEYYRASDLFVLPSYFEGNSNSVLEAMASGAPHSINSYWGNVIIGRKYRKGLFDRTGNRSALLNVLAKLLRSKAEMQELGADLAKRVIDCFNIEMIASYYCECYKLLASRHFDAIGELKNPVQP